MSTIEPTIVSTVCNSNSDRYNNSDLLVQGVRECLEQITQASQVVAATLDELTVNLQYTIKFMAKQGKIARIRLDAENNGWRVPTYEECEALVALSEI